MSPFAKVLIGLAAVFLLAWLHHGPLGNGKRFIDRLESESRVVIVQSDLSGISVRMQRTPLARVAILSGSANDFQRNGMGSFVEQWSQGNTQPNPTAIENGTAGTGLIDGIAQRTGLSPGVVRGGLAIAVPLLIHHMVSNNHVTPTGVPTGNQPEPTSVLQSVLQRIV